MGTSKKEARSSRGLTAILLVAIAAGSAAILWWNRPPTDSARDVAAPGPVGESAAGRPIEAPEFEKLRRRTIPGADRFEVETLAAELAPKIRALEAEWRDLPRDRSSDDASDLVAPTFRWTAQHADARPAASMADGLRALLGRGVESLDHVALKIVRVEPVTEGELATELRFELVVRPSSGAHVSWTGRARVLWTSERKIRGWKTLSVDSVETTGPFLRDVSAAVLHANAVYHQVLAHGIDHFRDRLDAATGIDVYGHYGIAVGDANSDGLDDLYLPMPPTVPNVLLLGQTDGTFRDASTESGANLLDGTTQALFLDLDNDGDDDIVALLDAGACVLRGDGRGRFAVVPDAISAGSARGSPITVAAADYDADGILDLYVGSYVFWRDLSGAVGSRLPTPYHDAQNGAPNRLLRGRGDGTFEDATAVAGLGTVHRFTFAASWADYDSDGDADLYVANDFGSNQLFRNRGDGTFEDVARVAGVVDIGPGMSVEWFDYDRDGDFDLYVGNMFSAAGQRVTNERTYKAGSPDLQHAYRRHARGNSLYRNRGDGTFEDASEFARATFGRWAWASGNVDFDLDGHDDLYVQNGFVSNARGREL